MGISGVWCAAGTGRAPLPMWQWLPQPETTMDGSKLRSLHPLLPLKCPYVRKAT